MTDWGYGYLYTDGTGAPRRTPAPEKTPKHTHFKKTHKKLMGTWEHPYVEPDKKEKDENMLDLMEQFHVAMDKGDMDEMERIMTIYKKEKGNKS